MLLESLPPCIEKRDACVSWIEPYYLLPIYGTGSRKEVYLMSSAPFGTKKPL